MPIARMKGAPLLVLLAAPYCTLALAIHGIMPPHLKNELSGGLENDSQMIHANFVKRNWQRLGKRDLPFIEDDKFLPPLPLSDSADFDSQSDINVHSTSDASPDFTPPPPSSTLAIRGEDVDLNLIKRNHHESVQKVEWIRGQQRRPADSIYQRQFYVGSRDNYGYFYSTPTPTVAPCATPTPTPTPGYGGYVFPSKAILLPDSDKNARVTPTASAKPSTSKPSIKPSGADIDKVDNTSDPSKDSTGVNNTNLPSMLGLFIGVPIAAVIVFGGAYYFIMSRKKPTTVASSTTGNA